MARLVEISGVQWYVLRIPACARRGRYSINRDAAMVDARRLKRAKRRYRSAH